MVKLDMVIQMVIHHSRERVSTAPESNGGKLTPLHPTLGIAHGDLRLVCGCSAMGTNFMKLATNSFLVLMLLPEAVWNPVVSVATEDRQFLHATCFSYPVL